ncbi:MAG: POTRA domain-containing protein, partial [Terriglobia bacterium]
MGACCALLAASCAARAAGEEAFRGETVVTIKFRTDANLNPKDFQQEITQKTGEPLDPAKISESLKKLYATGRFQALEAEAEPAAGGVALIFAGEARFFIGVVRVSETPRAVPPESLATGARLNLGQPLSQSALEEARKRIQSVMAANAYYRARVSYKVTRHPESQVAEVVFSVIPGAPALLSQVRFQGNAVVAAARLEQLAGWKKGSRLTPAKIQHGLYRIRTFLGKRDYLEATVNTLRREFDARRNTETLIVSVKPGPVVRVRTEGARVPVSQLKKILPVYTDGLTDDLSLDTGSDALADYFEKEGYFSAHVRWNRIQHPDETDITYIIDPGARSTFGGYAFKGNHSISSADLSNLVTLEPASFPTRLRGVFSKQMLDHDVNAIKALYRSKGFLDARVDPQMSSQAGDLFVTFDIDEGPITRVDKVSIQGVDQAMASQLRPQLQAVPGHAYSPGLVAKDRNAMLTSLANQGFNQAAISTHVSNAGGHRMDIGYTVEQGSREYVQNIVVMGNEFTREGVIRRQLTLQRGQPLDQSKLLESQRNLYNLGLFNSVQIAPENPRGAEPGKTVLVRVEEAQRWTLGYGFGLDVQRLGGGQPQGSLGVSPRLSLDLTRIDVGGRNQTISLRTRVSDLETGGEASYVIPNFLNHPNLTFHLDGIAYRTRDILTFTSMISQGSLSLQKQFTPFTYWVNRYNYRLVSVSDLKINQLQIPLFNQPVRDAGFESTLIHDTRDDPANATRGSYSLVDGSISSTELGSQASFTR